MEKRTLFEDLMESIKESLELQRGKQNIYDSLNGLCSKFEETFPGLTMHITIKSKPECKTKKRKTK